MALRVFIAGEGLPLINNPNGQKVIPWLEFSRSKWARRVLASCAGASEPLSGGSLVSLFSSLLCLFDQVCQRLPNTVGQHFTEKHGDVAVTRFKSDDACASHAAYFGELFLRKASLLPRLSKYSGESFGKSFGVILAQAPKLGLEIQMKDVRIRTRWLVRSENRNGELPLRQFATDRPILRLRFP